VRNLHLEIDDYVNATNWSKAFGKEWKSYRRSSRFKKLADVLTKDYQVQILHLVEAKPGKVPETWASPEIAIDKQLLRRTLDLM